MFTDLYQEYKQALIYQAYFESVYKNQEGFIKINQERFNQFEAEKICSTYGELSYHSVLKILRKAKLTQRDTLLDLGSGSGKFVLQARIHSEALQCIGIEAVSELVDQAIQAKNQMQTQIPQLTPILEHAIFKAGNFLNMSWQDVTAIYTCSTCFTNDLLAAIGEKINNTPTVKQVYSLRPIPNLSTLKLGAVFTVECSWDSAQCFYYMD